MPERRVLVVESEEHLRHMEGCLLEESGFAVFEAETADEGLDCLRNHADEIELLVVDADGRGPIDGLAVAREAKDRWPWIRTVVTSAKAVEHLPPNVVLLHKPFAPLDLLIVAERTAAAAA